MKPQNLITNPWNPPRSVVPPEVSEGGQKNGPSPAGIRRRAFEIHVEHDGIHGCDLNDWLEAERELQQKYKNEVHEHR
jgi:Protein of unknown function (DUF2934)